ncbi:hypothetical protein Cantr_01627 [Candida viswanathii]|uniref:Uncharacterized protein n=1 Tax=Candida viswanathii TaxID=5486 RepID=A0A367YIU2_9ASCO|nr:hypothetical protein Cantr_01627 [Candida viswanathii]
MKRRIIMKLPWRVRNIEVGIVSYQELASHRARQQSISGRSSGKGSTALASDLPVGVSQDDISISHVLSVFLEEQSVDASFDNFRIAWL